MPLPPTVETGDLPEGVHRAPIQEVLNRFGQATAQRKLMGMRLRRIYELVVATGHVRRFIVFGSFVTDKAEPTTPTRGPAQRSRGGPELAAEARWNAKGYRRGYGDVAVIANDQELKVTLDRIAQFQAQVAHLRNMETSPTNYHAAVSGFLAEIDRMQLEVREYLSLHPRELTPAS